MSRCACTAGDWQDRNAVARIYSTPSARRRVQTDVYRRCILARRQQTRNVQQRIYGTAFCGRSQSASLMLEEAGKRLFWIWYENELSRWLSESTPRVR
jgi:hypothetical protein